MSTVYDYVAEMEMAVVKLRQFTTTTASAAGMPPDLAHVVCLAVPHARWGGILGDENLNRRIRLDWLAAHHLGGYFGYDFDLIEDLAERFAHEYLERGPATCAVCGGPWPDGSGCEFCPR